MKIIVCIKQVPDTTEIRIDPVKGTLMRDGVPSILNPDDANALEAALQIKDEYPGTVVDVVTMGPQAGLLCAERMSGHGGRRCLSSQQPRFRRCGYLLHQHDTGLRHKEDRRLRFYLRGKTGHRRRYRSGRSSAGAASRTACGHLCAEHQRDPGEFQ